MRNYTICYSMPAMTKLWLTILAVLLAVALAGCGGMAEESSPDSFHSMPAQPQMAEITVERAVSAPAAPAAPTITPQAAMAEQETAGFAAETVESFNLSAGDGDFAMPSFREIQASVAAQDRIIVRTVDMTLVADDIPRTVERIVDVAQDAGGWMVSSDRDSIHYGQVSVRVPAQALEDVLRQIRGLAVDVEAEFSTSQDVTDEYVDNNSRLRSLRATEESLLDLLGRAERVEDALEVRQTLAELQVEIEQLTGRIRFLEQTAAFSLVNVRLSLAPGTMTVDAGPDQTYSVGQGVRFRAHFTPPQGIERFAFTWDFGDGSPPVSGSGSAPTTEPGQRVTATVNHFYEDDRDSPYIVQLEITGTGPAGLVEGSDTRIATVTRIPTIEVFAGEGRVVAEGAEVEYSGSFTRPEGLWDLRYRWDFGDGSPTVTGVPEAGATRVATVHAYENYRRQPYEVTLTVTAQSDAGEVKGLGSFPVVVNELESLFIAGLSVTGTAEAAFRALARAGQLLALALMWLAIFSPVWLALGGVLYGLNRLRRRFRRPRRPAPGPAPAVPNPNPEAPPTSE